MDDLKILADAGYEQASALAEIRTQLVTERNLLWRYKQALEGLTPSGSEFVNDPENCALYVRDTMNRQHETIKRFKFRADALHEFVKRVADRPIMLSTERDLIEEARALERGIK
jgi:hypothetical protein